MKIANDKAGIKKIIDDDERDKFIESLRVSEGKDTFIEIYLMNQINIHLLLLVFIIHLVKNWLLKIN